jgi:predicted RNA-binding Zn ribbon-like protein
MEELDQAKQALMPVRSFVDTYDTEEDREEIATPEALRAWLVGRGLLDEDAAVTGSDVETAKQLREALRALMFANTGYPLDQDAVPALNAAAERAGMIVQFDPQGHSHLDPAVPGVDGALGKILAVVFTAMADGTWPRVKVCVEHTCLVTFFDESKNGSRTWCSMRVCGNRAKARAYRERHKERAR